MVPEGKLSAVYSKVYTTIQHKTIRQHVDRLQCTRDSNEVAAYWIKSYISSQTSAQVIKEFNGLGYKGQSTSVRDQERATIAPTRAKERKVGGKWVSVVAHNTACLGDYSLFVDALHAGKCDP